MKIELTVTQLNKILELLDKEAEASDSAFCRGLYQNLRSQTKTFTYSGWEDQVTTKLASKIGCQYSDAAGTIEANEFLIAKCWSRKMSPISTANTVYNTISEQVR